MFCEECGKRLEDHAFWSSSPNLALSTACTGCGKPLEAHRITCGHCGRGFCGEHAHPAMHECPQTLRPVASSENTGVSSGGTGMYMTLVTMAGIGVVILGFGLVAGNISGAFPTFPFAGFLTSSLGFAMVGYGAEGKF